MKFECFYYQPFADFMFTKRIYLFMLCILLTLGVGLSTPMLAIAQETDGWADPVNLSRSGATINPYVVVDTQGLVHVVWEDEFAGWVYTRFDGEQWSTAISVNLPFATQALKFASDGQGRIHSFWINQEGAVLHSRVSAANFSNPESWSEPLVLAFSALAFKMTPDSRGEIHLAYTRPMQTIENPAGIYYRRTAGSGDSWTSPVSLYQSPYLRGLARGNASVDIAAALVDEQVHLHLTWDNRPRKEVFLSVSRDAGQTWTEPTLIDRPDPQRGLATPFNPMAAARGAGVMLSWQVGEPGASCRQYFQWSPDGAVTFGEPLPLLTQFFSCPQENIFFTSGDGNLVLMSTILDNVYLSAWDGARWSQPQLQGILRGFEDPQVLAQVRLGCRQAAISPNSRLYLVGCDQAGGGDIWVISRSLLDTERWLGTPPVWSSPEVVAENTGGFSDPVLVYDGAGNLHAFWSQVDEDATTLTGRSAIFYARWDGERWSNPTPILTSAGEDYWRASVAYNGEGRLLITWSGRDSGNVYFAWASAAQALRSEEWTNPQVIPAMRPAGSTPFIVSGSGERVWITYTIPVNEGRGVYLVESLDHGITWSEPMVVFDAALAGWEMVERPRLALTGDGNLHAVFERYSQPGGSGSLGLYYSRSEDGGETWSAPALVSESPLAWSHIYSDGAQALHRLWQESGSGAVWHAYSTNGGIRWSRAERIPALATTFGTASATIDRGGSLHVFTTVKQTGGDLVMQHWTRSGAAWRAQESFQLAASSNQQVYGVSASIDPSGQLGLVYRLAIVDVETRSPIERLAFTRRTVQVGQAPPLPTLVPEPSPTPTQTPTPSPLLTPTIDPALLQEKPGNSRGQTGDNQFLGIILGVTLASLLVAVGFGVVMVRRKAQ
jgi:hypothetical protein